MICFASAKRTNRTSHTEIHHIASCNLDTTSFRPFSKLLYCFIYSLLESICVFNFRCSVNPQKLDDDENFWNYGIYM